MSWAQVRGHEHLVESFNRAVARGRLAHAYLFVGPPGVGKNLFAQELAKAILCEAPPLGLRGGELRAAGGANRASSAQIAWGRGRGSARWVGATVGRQPGASAGPRRRRALGMPAHAAGGPGIGQAELGGAGPRPVGVC